MRVGQWDFCDTCGCIKSQGESSDCINCIEKIKERMRIEFNEELE